MRPRNGLFLDVNGSSRAQCHEKVKCLVRVLEWLTSCEAIWTWLISLTCPLLNHKLILARTGIINIYRLNTLSFTVLQEPTEKEETLGTIIKAFTSRKLWAAKFETTWAGKSDVEIVTFNILFFTFPATDDVFPIFLDTTCSDLTLPGQRL